jgi:hypothetical protein
MRLCGNTGCHATQTADGHRLCCVPENPTPTDAPFSTGPPTPAAPRPAQSNAFLYITGPHHRRGLLSAKTTLCEPAVPTPTLCSSASQILTSILSTMHPCRTSRRGQTAAAGERLNQLFVFSGCAALDHVQFVRPGWHRREDPKCRIAKPDVCTVPPAPPRPAPPRPAPPHPTPPHPSPPHPPPRHAPHPTSPPAPHRTSSPTHRTTRTVTL